MWKKSLRPLSETRNLVLIGLMIALHIILTRYLSIPIGPAVRLSLGCIAAILAGMWMGPAAGGIVGAAADTLGLMMAPSGAWLPLLTLSAACFGILPGFFMEFINAQNLTKGRRTLRICLMTGVVSLICQLITSFGLFLAFGAGVLPGRLTQFVLTTPIYMFLISALYQSPLTRIVRSTNSSDQNSFRDGRSFEPAAIDGRKKGQVEK